MSKVGKTVKAQGAMEERQAITGMIVDVAFLRQIVPITNLDYFKMPYTRIVAQWCLDYFAQFEEAPGRVIEDLFNAQERSGELDEADARLISRFLDSISEEHERGEKRSTEYLARCTEQYFKKRALELLKEDITRCLSNGDTEGAEEILATYKAPQRGGASYVNPFTDAAGIEAAFTSTSKPLFKLPGALGKMWNEQLVRDAFIGIMGPEKRGKTWTLMYLAQQAARQRCNVAFFAVGDMTKHQMEVRFAIMNAKRSNRAKYCKERLIPTLDCHFNQMGTCDRQERVGDEDLIKSPFKDGKPMVMYSYEDQPNWDPCLHCFKDRELRSEWKGAAWYRKRPATDPLVWQEAVQLGKEFHEKVMRGKSFRLECHARGALNVKGIRTILRTWEANDGYVPDVVVVDYADNMGPEDSKKEFRHQQNDTWGAFRALSQELNCLVVTATQADAASYNRKILREDNFSEDKRKYSHVTAILTLNQDAKEKKKGIMRLGMMFVREDEFDTTQVVTVLQDIASGQPVVASFI